MNILSGFWGIQSQTGAVRNEFGVSSAEPPQRVTIRTTKPFWRGLKWAIVGAAAAAMFVFGGSGSTDKERAYNIIDDKPESWVVDTLQPLIDAQEGPSCRWSWWGNAHFYGKTSPAFQQQVTAAWEHIPKAFKDLLRANEYALLAGPSTTEIKPELRRGSMTYSDPDERRTPNDSYGFTFLRTKEITVSEYYTSAFLNQGLSHQSLPTPEGLIAGDWLRHVDFVTQGVVNHETGHAINHTIEDIIGTPLSEMPDFIEAYDADLAALGGPEGALGKDYAYYTDPRIDAKVRHDEMLAEQIAHVFGGGARDAQFVADWPATHAYVKNFVSGYIAAHAQGLKQQMQFIDKIDGKSNDPNKVRLSASEHWLSELRRRVPSWKEFTDWRDALSGSLPRAGLQMLLNQFGWGGDGNAAPLVSSGLSRDALAASYTGSASQPSFN